MSCHVQYNNIVMSPDLQSAGVWQLGQVDQELRLPSLHSIAGCQHTQPQDTSKTTPTGMVD